MRIFITILLLLPLFSFSQINQTDANGLRQGLWQKKQANGRLIYEGNFKDGKPIGVWKRYHEGGQVKAQITYTGDTAHTQLFDIWKKKVAEGIYINEKKEGLWNYFNANQKKIVSEEFVSGKKHGVSSKFYETGELMETTEWKNGIQRGKYQFYFKDGKPYMQCKMTENLRNGLCIINFKNGRTELEANYKNNLRHGEWKYFNENGEFLYTLKYFEGDLLNPQVKDSIETHRIKQLELGKETLIDPEKFMQDPSEYMNKMKIYK